MGVELGEWPLYDKVAEAYGMSYYECDSNDDIENKLDILFGDPEAGMLVCRIDEENRVK
jgi:thiamine pyrophosphate-dependent acetolactate synthase large subunit-like protein